MTLGGAAHARTVDTHLLPVLEKVVAATHELTGEGHELLRQRYQNHLRALGLRYLKVRAARCWGKGGTGTHDRTAVQPEPIGPKS